MASSDWAGAGRIDVSADTRFAPLDTQRTSAVWERACNRSAENALEDTSMQTDTNAGKYAAELQLTQSEGGCGLRGVWWCQISSTTKVVAAVSGGKFDGAARWRKNKIRWWRRRSCWCSGRCCVKFYWSQIFYLCDKANFLFHIHKKRKWLRIGSAVSSSSAVPPFYWIYQPVTKQSKLRSRKTMRWSELRSSQVNVMLL